MNAPKIILKIVKFVNALLPGKPTQYRVALQKSTRVTNSKIVQNISDHTGLSKTYVKAVVDALPEAINDYAMLGNTVELEDFLVVKPYIKVKAADALEKANANSIVRRTFQCRPVGAFAELPKAWRFETIGGSAEEGEANDENSGLTDENDNQQTGDQNQQTTKYTITWKHNGSVVRTDELAEGENIVEPTAPTGYEWGSHPVTMPARDLTVTTTYQGDTEGL